MNIHGINHTHRDSADEYTKGTDTMDVWFDSGTSWAGTHTRTIHAHAHYVSHTSRIIHTHRHLLMNSRKHPFQHLPICLSMRSPFLTRFRPLPLTLLPFILSRFILSPFLYPSLTPYLSSSLSPSPTFLNPSLPHFPLLLQPPPTAQAWLTLEMSSPTQQTST